MAAGNQKIYSRDEKNFFVNPYNFVPIQKFNESCRKDPTSEKHQEEAVLTGYFDCTLITRTPLAVPDTERAAGETAGSSQDAVHYSYPFMELPDGTKYIPGSSIRGVLRSAYETLTGSCFVNLEDAGTLTTRVAMRGRGDVYLPGLLIREKVSGKEQWNLYSADRASLPLDDKYHGKKGGIRPAYYGKNTISVNNTGNAHGQKNTDYAWGQKVWFTTRETKNGRQIVTEISASAKKTYGWKEGCIYIGEAPLDPAGTGKTMGLKRAEGVFTRKGTKPLAADLSLEGLEKTLEVYRDKAINRTLDVDTHSGYVGYERARDEFGVIPIWYKQEQNGKIYLSAASIGRRAYQNNIAGLTGAGHCTDRKALCPACRLFGMIGRNGADGFGSRVRVTDAVCVKDTGLQKEITLRELGAPRTSYLPFYAEGGRDYDAPGADIRGRKYYWHYPEAAKSRASYAVDDPKKDKTQRNSTMDLLNPGAVFTFRVYFDGISKDQLDELAWTISLGENDRDGAHCYKIGHGKPLGLGSVKIVIGDETERSFGDGQYKLTVISGKEGSGISAMIEAGEKRLRESAGKKTFDAFRTITDYNALKGKTVCYPYISKTNLTAGMAARLKENDLASHQWFTQYRKDREVMPDIPETADKDMQLQPYMYPTDTGGAGHGYGSAGQSRSQGSRPQYRSQGGGYSREYSTAYSTAGSTGSGSAAAAKTPAPKPAEGFVAGKSYKGVVKTVKNGGKKVRVQFTEREGGVDIERKDFLARKIVSSEDAFKTLFDKDREVTLVYRGKTDGKDMWDLKR